MVCPKCILSNPSQTSFIGLQTCYRRWQLATIIIPYSFVTKLADAIFSSWLDASFPE